MPFNDDDPSIQTFYDEVAAHQLQPLWALHGLMQPAPPRNAIPTHWSGADLLRLARRSGELIGFDRGGDRRVLSLSNPGLTPKPFATATLWGAIQYLGPGESAPPHRHSPAAIRFVLQGSGVVTVVDGTPVPMEPGDLVITPAGCWHEHSSTGTSEMMWFDGLDLPLIAELDAMFFDPGVEIPETLKHATNDTTAIAAVELLSGVSPGLSAVTHATPRVTNSFDTTSSRARFAWADIDAALNASMVEGISRIRCTEQNESKPSDKDVLATLRCEFIRLAAGASHTFTRRAESNIVVVYQGSGLCNLGNETLPQQLQSFDCVALPTYTCTTVTANGDSHDDETLTLFVLSDAPVMEALGVVDVAHRLGRVP